MAATVCMLRVGQVDEHLVADGRGSVQTSFQRSEHAFVEVPMARVTSDAASGHEKAASGREEACVALTRPCVSLAARGAQGMEAAGAAPPCVLLGSRPRLACGEGHGVALQLRKLAHEVCAHYRADFCVIALHGTDGGLRVLAHHGIHREAVESVGATDPNAFPLFRHHVARDLPIIIEDTHDIPTVRDHPLVVDYPRIRFYAAAPLSTGSGKYSGTLSVGSMQPRDFRLEAAGVLQQKAAEAVAIMKSSARLKRASGGA